MILLTRHFKPGICTRHNTSWMENYSNGTLLMAQKVSKENKMKGMTELPFDILNLIFILVTTSTNGARALVRISKTCKKLKDHAEQASVLRLVSFQGLTDDYIKHLHPRDLIFQCAVAFLGRLFNRLCLSSYDFIRQSTNPL